MPATLELNDTKCISKTNVAVQRDFLGLNNVTISSFKIDVTPGKNGPESGSCLGFSVSGSRSCDVMFLGVACTYIEQ